MGDLLGYLLTGLGTTLRLLAASLALGLAIGLLVALARLSRARLLRWSSTVYVEVVRGVPLLVLLLFIYYGLPQVLNGLGGGGRRPLFQISDFLSAVIAFGVCYGAYLAEIFRAGIKSVDPGQTEAARALGLSHRQAMRHVVLPQAIRNVLPALVNESGRIHPMHLHGQSFRVLAVNGNRAAEPLVKDSVDIAAHMGSAVLEFTAHNPGDWLFHCHKPMHMEGGMVVLIKVGA